MFDGGSDHEQSIKITSTTFTNVPNEDEAVEVDVDVDVAMDVDVAIDKYKDLDLDMMVNKADTIVEISEKENKEILTFLSKNHWTGSKKKSKKTLTMH